MSKFELVMLLWMSLIMNGVLSFVMPLAATGSVSWSGFLRGFAIAFTVSTIFALIVPIVPMGHRFARHFGAEFGSLRFVLLSSAVMTLAMGTFMTLFMTAVNAGLGPHFPRAWASTYPASILASYPSSVLGTLTGLPVARRIAGAPPK